MPENYIPLLHPAGIVSEQTPAGAVERFMDASWVRFWRGKAQKIGGYASLFKNAGGVIGTPRGTHIWTDGASNQIGVGTNQKLYLLPTANFTPIDITPFAQTQINQNGPISTTALSRNVNVLFPAHGAVVGDYIDIDGADNVDNFAPNGSWPVAAVVDQDNVTIVAPVAAINTVAGGGGAVVTLSSEITMGPVSPIPGLGWGAGAWGDSTWGTPRPSSTITLQPRIWSFGNFGKVLIANPIGGPLYSFDPTVAPLVHATQIAAAPSANSSVVVTSDEIVIALGSSYDAVTTKDGGPGKQDLMQWWAAAQGDYTNWDTTEIAGNQGSPSVVGNLIQGTKIIGGLDLGTHVTLVWTDTALYSFQYTGSQFVFNITLAGRECGLVGPMACVSVDSTAFWMAPTGFYMYNGGVHRIPNYQDISEWVIRQLRGFYTIKTFAWYNQEFNEVWFAFVVNGQEEPRFYVAVNLDDFSWTRGMFPEAVTCAARFTGFDPRPIVCGADGDVYQLENGLDADGAPLPWYLQWGPMEISDGSIMQDISGLVIDMERQSGTISAQITTYDRTPAVQTIMDQMTRTFVNTDNFVDFRVSGRDAVMKWSGGTTLGDDFRIGIPKLVTTQAGARR